MSSSGTSPQGNNTLHRKSAIPALATLALLLTLPARAAPPAVLTTIKPLHALAAEVMEGVGTPTLLMDGTASPHGFALRPSDASALQRARLVVWVGPSLENFLIRFLEGKEHLAVQDLPGIRRFPQRQGGAWETDDHGHDHGHDAVDPHLWLDPANAREVLTHLATTLSRLDPEHAPRYQENAQRWRQRLATLEQELDQQLSPIRQRPYLVFHDAYQYFEKRFRLAAAGAVTLSPETQPGARWVKELRQRTEQARVACLFSEPQFQPRLVATLVEGTRVKTGQLDPLGAALPAGPEMYPRLLQGLRDALLACLG